MTPRQMLEPQPIPVGGYGSVTDDVVGLLRARWPLSPVIGLLQIRREQGASRYGQELRYLTGRDYRCDLLQEVVDGILYARACGRHDLVVALDTTAADLYYELERVQR